MSEFGQKLKEVCFRLIAGLRLASGFRPMRGLRLMAGFRLAYASKLAGSFALILCLGALVSCEKQPSFTPATQKKPVILAEITAGETVAIPLSISMIAGSGEPVSFEKVTNAQVSLTGGSVWTLKYDANASGSRKGASVYTHRGIVKHNTAYTLSAGILGLETVTATVTVPSPLRVTNVSKEEEDFGNLDVLEFKFDIQDKADEANYYIFEALKQPARKTRHFYWQGKKYDYDTPEGKALYERLDDDDIDVNLIKDTAFSAQLMRLNVFTRDPAGDNSTIGNRDSAFSRIFLRDSLFNGNTHSVKFLIDMTHFESKVRDQKGIVIVRVKSVDKAFYEYMLQYDKYHHDLSRMPASQLGEPLGNIQNGLGVFGASSKQEWRLYYDDL